MIKQNTSFKLQITILNKSYKNSIDEMTKPSEMRIGNQIYPSTDIN